MSASIQSASEPCTTAPGFAGEATVRTRLSGINLLLDPALNKGTAFTEEERDLFELHGLFPPHVGTLEDQRLRRKLVLDSRPTAFGKYSYMRDLQDSDETLFYSLIAHHVEEFLPIVYTPAVGEGCQRFSEIWRRPRGLFISYPNRDRIDQILSHARYEDVRCIVVSDGERILGLGDQGAGGMGIPIGKMALYTSLGGIPPQHCLPILLDVGTDNESLLSEPYYIGWQHKRVRGQEYNDFIEAFVTAVQRRWPHILLQWEDFAGTNALNLLDRYRNRLCIFNDDIQGTAAITTATLLAAVNATGIPLHQQTIAIYGSGSAGVGIIDLLITAMRQEGLTEDQARQRIYAFNRHGLLVEGCDEMRPSQKPLARKRGDVANWRLSVPGTKASRSTTWSTTPESPCWQASAPSPAHLPRRLCARWLATRPGRHLPALQSNFAVRGHARRFAPLDRWPRHCWNRQPFPAGRGCRPQVRISQVNNAYIFPGLALGILVSRARQVTDNMFMAATRALASLSPALTDKNAPLLPPITECRQISLVVAEAAASRPSPTESQKLRPMFHSLTSSAPTCGSQSIGRTRGFRSDRPGTGKQTFRSWGCPGSRF